MITIGRLKKVQSHKGFIIAVSKTGEYYVFSKEEWNYGYGCRSEEFECGSIQESIDFINSY